MAENSQDELNNRREQSKVEQEINRAISAREQAYRASVRSAGDALDISRQITEDIKDQLGLVRAKSESDIGALNLARKLQASVQQVTTELGNQGKVQRQILNDQNLLSSIRTEISNIDRKIGEQNASNAKTIAESLLAQQDLQREIEELQQEINYLGEEDSKLQQERIKSLKGQVVELDVVIQQNEELLKAQGQYQEGDVRRLVQLKQQEALGEKLIEQRKVELDIQRRIEDHTGVTGALVEGVGGIMQRLGMRSGIFQNAMELSAATMKDMSEETIRTQDNIDKARHAMEGLKKDTDEYNSALADVKAAELGKQFSKTQIAIAGATELAKGFSKALRDPLTITLAIVDGFLDVNKAAVNFTRLTGENATAVAGLNDRLATSVQVLETAAELTRQIGLSATSIFSPQDLGRLAEAKNLLGITSEQAGNLGLRSKVAGQNIDAYQDSLLAGVDAGNRLAKSAVAPGIALQDALSASDGITLSFSKNTKELGKAATAARALGLELSRVDQIAESLLDFESSIEAELEAQLLTGKNINLAKARELALNNDLAGLSSELAKNGASAAEFANMNRIQQNALAKSLGMSRDELAKTILTQQAAANLTDEQRAKVLGVTTAQLQQIDIQKRIQTSLDKLAQAFAPILDAIVPIVEILSSILQPVAQVIAAIAGPLGSVIKFVLTPVRLLAELFAKVANTGFGKVVIGIGLVGLAIKKLSASFIGLGSTVGSVFKNIGSFIKSPIQALKSQFSSIQDTLKGVRDAFKEGLAGKVQQKIEQKSVDKTEELAGKAKGQEKGLSSVDKFNKLDTKSMLRGAAAIAVLSGALFISAKAFQEFADVTWESVAQGLVAIAGLTVAAFALSKLKGPIIQGALAIAVLGGALIPLAAALRIAAPAFVAFGQGIKLAFEGVASLIGAVFTPLTEMFGILTLEKAIAVAALGPAFMSVGAGLVALGAGAIVGMAGLGVLAGISAIGPGLALAGQGVTQMAEAVARLGTALQTLETEKLREVKDLISTTALAAPAVAATGAITQLINGITGGGEQSSNKELLQKLDEVVAAVSNIRGNVYMDGNQVGNSIFSSAQKTS